MITKRLALITMIVLIAIIAMSFHAMADMILIDNSTPGYYNDELGFALNGTNPSVDNGGAFTYLFPETNDPWITRITTEPDLSTASSALGNWLTDPSNPGGTWSSGVQTIPNRWGINSETAIIYQIDAGTAGIPRLIGEFGVDNGIFVWLDGVYQGGTMAPGTAYLGELTLDLGSLSPGTHHLQVLREDHGVATRYLAQVSAVPLPGAVWLMGTGLLGLLGLRKKISK